jgi:hypothetical protein
MIGSWDNSKVIFGILPKCWKNGNGNEDYGIIIEEIHDEFAILFPLYSGPANDVDNTYVKMIQNVNYESATGIIEPVLLNNDRVGMMTVHNFETNGMDNNTKTTWEYWGDIYATDVISTAVYFLYSDYPNTNDATNRLQMFIRNVAGAFSLRQSTGTGTYQNVRSTDFDPDGFHQFVWVKDGTNMHLYIDGVEVEYFVNDNWTGTYTPNPNRKTLDIWANYNSLTFNKKANNIHGVIIYNDALTAEEVLTNYNLGPDKGGLVGTSNEGYSRLTLSEPIPPKSHSTTTNDIIYHYNKMR